MVLTDVLTDALALPRAEQLQLIQELAAALLRDEATAPIESGREYPVWSPDTAFGAADVLLRSLGLGGREEAVSGHIDTGAAMKARAVEHRP